MGLCVVRERRWAWRGNDTWWRPSRCGGRERGQQRTALRSQWDWRASFLHSASGLSFTSAETSRSCSSPARSPPAGSCCCSSSSSPLLPCCAWAAVRPVVSSPPTLTLGALLGAVLGFAGTRLWPGVPLGLPAVLSAGAVLAATTQGPISAVVLMMELTGRDRSFIAPLLLAVAIATLVARTIEHRSI